MAAGGRKKYLKSNMDRFIAKGLPATANLCRDLKSNMDRFIVNPKTERIAAGSDLKSNMDRFIESSSVKAGWKERI